MSWAGLLALAAVAYAGSPMEHPRLLLKATDLPALRERSRHPEVAPWTTKLLQRCDALLNEPPVAPPPTPSTQDDRTPGELIKSRRGQGAVVSLALAWHLTGNRAYLDRAWGELECWMDRWTSWTDPYHGDAEFFDLMTGEMGMTMGLAYDWLRNDLNPEQRARLKEQIGRRIIDRYLANTQEPKVAWWMHSYHNWNTVCHGGAVIAALALEGEHPKVDEVGRRATASWGKFYDALGTEGGWDEGTGYWQYGMRYAIMALAALEDAGKPTGGLLDRDGTKQTGYFPISFCPGGVPMSWGDAVSPVRDPIFYYFGARYRMPDYIRYQDRIRDRFRAGEAPWPVEALAVLWRPVTGDWLPKPQSDYELAKTRVYREIGWSVFVDDLETPGLIAGMKCGDLGANHTQLDNNTFQLWAKGEWLAQDAGGGTYNADYFSDKRWKMYVVALEGHNGLLIGGKGQIPKTKGMLTKLGGGRNWDGAVGDATLNYGAGVKKARRHFVVVNRSYVIVVDEVATHSPQPVEWRLHAPCPVELGKDGRAKVTGTMAALHVAFPIDSVTLSAAADPGDLPAGKKEFVLFAKADSSASHLLPAVLFPTGMTDPAPVISFSRAADRLAVRVGMDTIIWRPDAAGNWSAASD